MIFDNAKRAVSSVFIVGILALIALFWGTLFENPPAAVEWRSPLSGLPDFVSAQASVVGAMIMLIVSGLLIYRINVVHFSIRHREHLLFILWILMTGAFSFFHRLSEIHFANLFIILTYNEIFGINAKHSGYMPVFTAALFLGVATLFYSYALYLFVPYLVALYRFKPVTLRDWAVSIAGFVTPFYFAAFVYHFWVNGDWRYPVAVTIQNIIPHFPFESANLTVAQYVFCLLVAFLMLIGFFMGRVNGSNQKTISCDISLWRFFIFAVAIFFIFAPDSKLILQIVWVPACFVLHHFFVHLRSAFLANLTFLAIIAAAVACVTA